MVLGANDSCPSDCLLSAHYVPHTVLAPVATEENTIEKNCLLLQSLRPMRSQKKKNKQKLTSGNNVLVKRTRQAFPMR